MRLSRLLPLVLTAACTASRALAQAPTASETSVLQADAAWSAAVGAHDLDRSVAPLAADGSIAAPNESLAAGPEQVRALFRHFFSLQDSDFGWTATSVRVAKAEDMAITGGTYHLALKTPDGRNIRDKGKYVIVWVRAANGSWQVLRDIFNSDLPGPS